MALNINSTKLKKCNVNGVKCKHITVNDTKVWSAEEILVGTEISDLSAIWDFHDKYVDREHSDGTESSYHVYCEPRGSEIFFRYGDHYADDAAEVYAETKDYYNLTDWESIYLDLRIVTQWAAESSKHLRIYLDIYNESGTRVMRDTVRDSHNYETTNIDVKKTINISSLTGNHKIRIFCGFGNSYQEVDVYVEQCILQ